MRGFETLEFPRDPERGAGGGPIVVPAGVYVSLRPIDLRVVTAERGPLTGCPGAKYVRLPAIMAVVLAPVLGGVFAVAFPLVIFSALALAAGAALRRAVQPVLAETPARAGVYVGLDRVGVRYLGADGERLPGEAGRRFLRIPTLLLILASPVLGGIYVLAFPLIMAAAIATVIGRALVAPLGALWDRLAGLSSPRWEPAMSYLQKAEDEADEEDTEAEVDEELEALEAEVEAKKADEGSDK